MTVFVANTMDTEKLLTNESNGPSEDKHAIQCPNLNILCTLLPEWIREGDRGEREGGRGGQGYTYLYYKKTGQMYSAIPTQSNCTKCCNSCGRTYLHTTTSLQCT